MKLTSLLALSLVTAVPALASAATYEVDPNNSSIEFAVKHMMVSTVRGGFGKVTGTVSLDDKDLKKASIDAVIDAASINTRVDKRDAHLRSPDFFDVARFPTITFKSTEVQKAGGDKYKVTGTLTMHGVSKPVVLDVVSATTEVKDPYGNMKRGAVITTTLNRKDFGLTWNKTLEAGGVMVSDTVNVTIDLQLTRKTTLATATH
jgi:polyisoprenoid-binding protein YceI